MAGGVRCMLHGAVDCTYCTREVPVPDMDHSHSSITDRTSDLMQLQDVHRWTVIKTGRQQSVAEHSYNVTVICIELMERLGLSNDPTYVARTLIWALAHDGPEVLTGDIDGKFKRDYPAVREAVVLAEVHAFEWYRDLTSVVDISNNAVVKLADLIEAIAFIEQWGIGARADDVKRELLRIMDGERIPKAATDIGVEQYRVREVVRHIMHQSVQESNCIQMRRHRGK